MTVEEQRSLTEEIPEGLDAVVTISLATSACPEGADAVWEALQKALSQLQFPRVLVRSSGGLGYFSAERLVKVTRPDGPSVLYHQVTPELITDIVNQHVLAGKPLTESALCQIPVRGDLIEHLPLIQDIPFFSGQRPTLSWRFGQIDPERIEDAIRTGSYKTLNHALTDPSELIFQAMESVQLSGPGGHGESLSERWRETARQPGPRYLICNALEVEPSAVKDRWLLESDPHRIIDGMVIAARAVGAEIGYIVLNPSYKKARLRLEMAIAQARRRRRLGKGIQNTAFDFDIRLRTGPPGFVTGEETALISFLEGKAGPRLTPPPTTVSGLHNRPTVVANVETFARLTLLPLSDASPQPSTRLFTLEGTPHHGVVEVEEGTTLREVVCGIGGMAAQEIKAVVIGGHLGGVVPADLLDTPLSEASYRWLNVWPGAGLISVLNRSTSMTEWLKDDLGFAARESCGLCTPCREGLEQARLIANRLNDGAGQAQDLLLLEQLAGYINRSSLCGYGQVVPGGMTTTLRYFGEELREGLSIRR